MIKASDAIEKARSLFGTPYREMDCIALIRAVIRRSPGGVPGYRCQGTNWLWDSIGNSGKYRHLIWRQEGISGAKAGMLAFKRYGADDVGHVGLVTGAGTVIHSSSVNGRGVVETALSAREGWDLLGRHRYIEIGEAADAPGETPEDEKADPETPDAPQPRAQIVIRDSEGRVFRPAGDYAVRIEMAAAAE